MEGGGKGAVASVMEAAANVAASAKSGLDKTKAVVEEKVERMSSKDEVEKDMATLRKDEKLDLAEHRKHKAYAQNAAAASAPPGAVSPNFTDGSGFDTISSHTKPAAILSSNADLGGPVAATSHVVEGSLSPVNPNRSELPASYHPGSVDHIPNQTEFPAQVVQPSPAIVSNLTNTAMPPQVQLINSTKTEMARPGNNTRPGTYMSAD
ncbi:hypothetical protein ACET3Z_024304 [Daucus carota]